MRYISVFVISLTVLSSFVLSVPPTVCVQCQQSQMCKLPDCSCCRDELAIPNLDVSQIPQMVFFTFDDAVTNQVAGFYHELFDSARKNPNGCPISMTLFISHDNTDYRLVSDFYRKGMEIASHSVTHSQMNLTNFLQEAKAQKENLAKLANVPIKEITGWRSPFLKPTGDLQPDSLKKLGYTYDATLTFSKRSLQERPPGPFTLDFGFPYECQVKPCPEHKHPGFWEVPVVSLMDYKQKYDCVYVDGCMNAPPDEESAYKFLWDNFNNYYTTTRMPFGINMHPSWFFYPDRLRAMDRFIQKLVSMNDVYIVSANKMLEWLKHPTPLSQLHSFAPFTCDGREKKFNKGPRLVKTNLPKPPSLRSWMPLARGNAADRITVRTMRPNNPYTPAPVFQQRQFTPTNRGTFAPRTADSVTIQRFSPRRENPNQQQQKIREELLMRQLRQWQQQRRRQIATKAAAQQAPAQKTSKPVARQSSVETSNTQKVESVQPTRKTFSQREIMEQHEQRLRQHQMLEEKQKRMERERLVKEKAATQKRLVSRQNSHPQRQNKVLSKVKQPSRSIQIQTVSRPATPRQQHVVWRPNIRPDLVPSETRQRRPVKVQQETIKIWPTSAPTKLPAVVRTNRGMGRFSNRRERPGGRGELLRLRDRLRRPVTLNNNMETPRRFPYNEDQVWYDNFGNRISPIYNENDLIRGGSNRRRGFDQPSSFPITHGSRRSQTSRMINDTHISNDIRQNQLVTNRAGDFLGGQHQSVPIQDNRLSRSRNLIVRNTVSPGMAQRMAWNNFIRQMFRPQ